MAKIKLDNDLEGVGSEDEIRKRLKGLGYIS